MMVDILGNPVNVGDTVVSYNHLYKVKSIGNYYMTIKLLNSENARNKKCYYKELVVVTFLIKENQHESRTNYYNTKQN